MSLLRGTTEGADCARCPFARDGAPNKPVCSEHPEKPLFVILGEGPGVNEVRHGRPFIGMSGEVVNKFLDKIGQPREQLFVGNVTLCLPPMNSPPEQREEAAAACKPRLMRELAQFPGLPVLTLGAVAARTVIPKAVLDAIDPPDVPKSKKRDAKKKQQAEFKRTSKEEKAVLKIAEKRLAAMLKHHLGTLVRELKRKHQAKPDHIWLDMERRRVRAQCFKKALVDARIEYDATVETRRLAKAIKDAGKPKKKKPIKITDIMGSTFDVDVDGTGVRPVIPGIHPAALLRGGGAGIGGTHAPDLGFINLTYDAAKIRAIAQGKDIRLKLTVETEFKDSDRAVELFLQVFWKAMDEGSVALDLETYVDDPERHNALMAYQAKIRAIGFATKDLAVSVLWDLLPSWTQTYIQVLLNNTTMVYHHGIYDQTVLKAYGFIIDADSVYEDTLLAHHAAFPGCSHRLQQVTAQFFAVAPWKAEFRNAEETPEGLTTYNAIDTGSTQALLPALAIHVKRTKTDRIYALDKKMARIASGMHLAGMPVDREVNADLLVTFSGNVKESRAVIEHQVADPKVREHVWHHLALQEASKKRKLDPDDFEERYQMRLQHITHDPKWKWKINSSKHISALLLAMGVQLTQMTDSGQISTKKDVLESLVDVPIVRDIVQFRENDKLYSTFCWPMFDRHVNGELVRHGYADENDRIHPIWSTHKISGRWASVDPVASNWAKDKWQRWVEGMPAIKPGVPTKVDKDTGAIDFMKRPNLRRQVVAPKGRTFVGFDFAQLEARIIGMISGDPFLLWVFSEGLDIHRECAKVLFPGFEQMTGTQQKKARNETKPLEYGAFYGGSIDTLWKQLLKEGRNVKRADVELSVRKLMAKMAGVVRWQHDSVQLAIQRLQCSDFVLGRLRTFPLGAVEAPEVLNFQAQATAAAIMNIGMAEIDQRLTASYIEAFPIGQFHDAALFECAEDDAERLMADVIDSFTQTHESQGISVPYTVEAKIATNWAYTD